MSSGEHKDRQEPRSEANVGQNGDRPLPMGNESTGVPATV